MSQQKAQELHNLLSEVGYHRARVEGLSNYDKLVGGIMWAISFAAPAEKWVFQEDEPGSPMKTEAQKRAEVLQILKLLEKSEFHNKVTAKDFLQAKAKSLEPVVRMFLSYLNRQEADYHEVMEALIKPSQGSDSLVAKVMEFFQKPLKLVTNCSRMEKFDSDTLHLVMSGKDILMKYADYAKSANKSTKNVGQTANMSSYMANLCSNVENLGLAALISDIEGQLTSRVKNYIVKQAEAIAVYQDYNDHMLKLGSIMKVDSKQLETTVQALEHQIENLVGAFNTKLGLAQQLKKEDIIRKIEFDEVLLGMMTNRLKGTHIEYKKTHTEHMEFEQSAQLVKPVSTTSGTEDPIMEKLFQKLKDLRGIHTEILNNPPRIKDSSDFLFHTAFVQYLHDSCLFLSEFIIKAKALIATDTSVTKHLEISKKMAIDIQKKHSYATEELENYKCVQSAIWMLNYQLPVWEDEAKGYFAEQSDADTDSSALVRKSNK